MSETEHAVSVVTSTARLADARAPRDRYFQAMRTGASADAPQLASNG